MSFVISLVASTFLMGSSFVAGKILLQQGFPPMILAGWRFLVAAFATFPMIAFDEGSFRFNLFPRGAGLREAALVVVIGLIQTAAVMGLLFFAMQFVSASTAAILLFTNPLWVAVLGRFFLGESLHRRRSIGLVLGIVGVCLAIGIGPDMFSGGQTLLGEFVGVLAALCWSFATIVNKRANLPFRAWSLSFWQMLIGSIALLALAYATGERWPATTTLQQWGWFVWLAFPASAASFGLWYVALSKGGATKSSGFLFLAPLFTVTLSYLVLGSGLSWIQAGGGGVIGMALWLINSDPPSVSRDEQIRGVLVEGEA